MTNEHADRVDLSQILNNPFAKAGEKVTFDPKDVYDFKLGATLDEKVLLKKFGPAMDKKEKKTVKVEITNTDRTVGTILGAETPENSAPLWSRIRTPYSARVPADRASEHLFQKD